jgi:hypothetical protein
VKKVHDIATAKSEHMLVKEILDEAIDHSFESVIVIGFKEGTVRFMRSKVADTVQLLGAIEAAKMQLWETT